MTKTMQKLGLLLAATALTAGVARAADDVSISLVLGQRNSGFHEAIACGARAAATELGVAVKIQAAPTYSASEQIPVLNSVMATSPSAIVLDPTSSTALIAPLMEAAANGAKIVAVDTTLDDPSVLSAVVGTDNELVGRETAKALAKALEGKSGKVAQINSIPGISTVDARIKGFEEEIKNYPNLTYIGNQFASEDIPKAQQAFVSLMSANPDLIGVVSQSNNPAIGVAGGIRSTQTAETVAAIAVDADDSEIEALNEGLLDALVIQQPYEMGYMGFKQAVAAVKGEPITTPISTGTVTATKANIGEPGIVKYLYKGNCI
ncbi:substrate-binding domain-containing protein [Phyllobacterium sp. 21LDTY02-6]|uniref:substrate-binding domain-containing protein n=1 Tax=unclassified Phyllobacterium TaxID=2638441 RepID=UPI0020228997|nr:MULTISPECIES: substrate-binding domain-containing protein [unclassified Phyllobacterium]MCO4317924.1 substrate-binding domain-containing protein [Phyllobacterium sp. 21LDTY02-6]MCX8282105.1 substrate-binding domain-containing protein [Phyllobacterium sp. 0TCS1.6C]MCX8296313.1 substrate-binding domain-containing protein [Phyllobacterium sp. 0TCS1.6A]